LNRSSQIPWLMDTNELLGISDFCFNKHLFFANAM
jgi:hypothetical protein